MVDIWETATAGSAGIVADDINELWTREWPALGDAEPEVFAVALSDRKDRTAEAAREALTAAYIGVTKRVMRAHAGHTDTDDLRQTALLGLWQGFREFDPSRHRRPVATVERNVLRALSDAHVARFGLSVPEAQRLAYAKARRAAADRIQATDYDGPDIDDLAAEIAPEFGLSTEDYWHVHRVAYLGEVLPTGDAVQALARRRSGDDAHGGEAAELSQPIWPQDVTPNVERELYVASLLETLSGREREVIELRYGLNGHPAHTEAEAAAALGLTERRIRQIVASALVKLREAAAA